jgi:hypothetical protein
MAPPPPGSGGSRHCRRPSYSSPERYPFFDFGFHHVGFSDVFETDIVTDMPAVWRDFDQIRKKAGIKGWKTKFVKRIYAFGEPDVPREETQWLKVVYGFEGTSS